MLPLGCPVDTAEPTPCQPWDSGMTEEARGKAWLAPAPGPGPGQGAGQPCGGAGERGVSVGAGPLSSKGRNSCHLH